MYKVRVFTYTTHNQKLSIARSKFNGVIEHIKGEIDIKLVDINCYFWQPPNGDKQKWKNCLQQSGASLKHELRRSVP